MLNALRKGANSWFFRGLLVIIIASFVLWGVESAHLVGPSTVASVNDIGLGAMRMADKGWQKGWGLGRHVLGSNYFHYVMDPWGSFSEYSCDIDYIPKEDRWPSADHKPEDSFYLWGPEVPREFVLNREAGES